MRDSVLDVGKLQQRGGSRWSCENFGVRENPSMNSLEIIGKDDAGRWFIFFLQSARNSVASFGLA